MRRREFINLLSGAAAGWPLAARAQQAERVRRIGVFVYLATDDPESSLRLGAFRQGLQALGWTENRNLRIEIHRYLGDPDSIRAAAAELVGLVPEVILSYGPAGVAALRRETRSIPIVFAQVTNPLGAGLVASLARPGGNVTGFSIQQIDTVGKRVEILQEVVPALRRLAVFSDFTPSTNLEFSEIEAAGRKLGIEIVRSLVGQADEIAPAFEALKGRADAVYVCATALVTTRQDHINALALGAHLPTMHNLREYVYSGGLMSYGPNVPDLFRRAADHVDKILRGTKPGDIPVQQPTKFDFVINLKTAKALGLTVPDTLLARADEVIE
jgi:putative ABC transport system substrate-binding protein